MVLLTKYIIGGTVIGLVMYDIVAAHYGCTISSVLADWSRENLIIAVGVGVLIGHWFWPL